MLTNEITDLEAAFSSVLMSEKYFVSPINKNEQYSPFSYQRAMMNIIDYGFDVEKQVIDPRKHGISYPEIVCMMCARQYGKTEGIATLVGSLLIRWDLEEENGDIGIMSNSENNAKKFVDRIYYYIANSPFKKHVKSRKVDRIIMKNGSGVFSFGMTENIRGNSLRILIVDEAAQFDDKLLEGAAMPTTQMAGAYRLHGTPSVILISTPRGNRGKFIEYYMSGIEMLKLGCRHCESIYEHVDFPQAKRWVDPNYPWLIPDVPNCPNCGKNNYEWIMGRVGVIKVDPFDHPYMTPEEIMENVNIRGNTPLARQEFLGEIISESNSVFTRPMLEKCASPDLHNMRLPIVGNKYVIGVDFGKLHDATVFCIGHRDRDGINILDYMEVLPGYGGREYEDIRYRLLKLISIWNPVWAVMDANGIGDPIVEQIDRDITTLRRMDIICMYNGQKLTVDCNPYINTVIYSNKAHRLGFVTDMNTKLDLIDNAVNCFARKLVRIPMEHEPGIKILWEELINYGFDYTHNNNIKYGTQRGHDDTVIAYCMMLYGLRERPWIGFTSSKTGSDTFVL